MISSRRSSNRLRRLSLSIGILLAFACGPGLFDENEFLSYFLPESSQTRPQDRRYFFSPNLYSTEDPADTLKPDDNLKAWASYAGSSVSMASVAKVLYDADESRSNPFYAQLVRSHAPALTYLQLAHKAEKASGGGDMWNPVPADTTQLTQLLAEAKAAYAQTADPFLKERYAFQAVKLADQIGEIDQSITLYDQLVGPISQKSFISDWALSRHAGATLAKGDTARAIYEFAQVFDRCPSRRAQAESSLRIHGIRFREEALTFARNDQEKAAVYAICAIQPRQDALPLLEKLVELAPQNPLVELTMTREINRNEYFFLSDQNPIYGYDDASRRDSLAFEDRKKSSLTYAEKLREFALKSADNKQLNDPAFWLTAASYLAYLDKDYTDATSILDKAALATTTNNELKKQISLQRMLLLAAQTEAITPETETKLIGYLEEFGNRENFRFNNAFVAVCKQFSELYLHGSNGAKSSGWLSGCSRSKEKAAGGAAVAKSYLLTMLTSSQLNKSGAYVNVNTDQLEIEDTTSASTVQQVVAFAEQPNATDFDKRLLTLTGFDADYLNTLLGRRLLAEHRYKEGGEALAKVTPKVWKEDPFTTYFDKNPFEVPPTNKELSPPNPYTPVQFAQRMAQLQSQVGQATGDDAAKMYYELGCGAYNLSWFGNAWLLVKRSRSSAELGVALYATNRSGELERSSQRLMKTPYYSTEPAKAFFEQAMKLAKQPELAAKACYMAARCEQNELAIRLAIEEVKRGYADFDEKAQRDLSRKLRREQYGQYFARLSHEYGKTQFQSEMLRECATYADYVANRP